MKFDKSFLMHRTTDPVLKDLTIENKIVTFVKYVSKKKNA